MSPLSQIAHIALTVLGPVLVGAAATVPIVIYLVGAGV